MLPWWSLSGVFSVWRIHQEGCDKLNRFSRAMKYDTRPLLGFSASDKDIVEEVVTEFFRE